MNLSHYRLPNSHQKRCLDRFSILDEDCDEDDEGRVLFWTLLDRVLQTRVDSTAQLIEVLDTISNLLRGSSGVAGDYGSLRNNVDEYGEAFFHDLWPKIVHFARQLPEHFPSGEIPVLRSGARLMRTKEQTASLVAHQFLCTLDCPEWRDGYFDFSIWYDSEQRHPQAVAMYFASLFAYFGKLGPPKSLKAAASALEPIERQIIYALHCRSTRDDSAAEEEHYKRHLASVSVEIVSQHDTSLQEIASQGPDGAVIVSANKHIGFGQSATQEEMYIGNCPEACPAVLFTPPLADNVALLIEGADPMLRITGQQREISWVPLINSGPCGGRMLLMDALEIDELDDSTGLPDLHPVNIDREITKAISAFSSWEAKGEEARVLTGPWGCGAFNGDPGVKMVLLWIAASLSGRRLSVICDPSHHVFASELKALVNLVPRSWTARDLRDLVGGIPKHTHRQKSVKAMLSLLKQLLEESHSD